MSKYSKETRSQMIIDSMNQFPTPINDFTTYINPAYLNPEMSQLLGLFLEDERLADILKSSDTQTEKPIITPEVLNKAIECAIALAQKNLHITMVNTDEMLDINEIFDTFNPSQLKNKKIFTPWEARVIVALNYLSTFDVLR